MTSRIEWTDEFKLGLPVIDAEHRELLEVCNQFLDAVNNGQAVAELARILEKMILLTRAHFVAEERMLDRNGYPGLVVHKAEHERLLIQAEALGYDQPLLARLLPFAERGMVAGSAKVQTET